MTTKYLLAIVLTFAAIGAGFVKNASAQRRDYLTEAEVELVRDAQEIDLRIGVLTKAVDRRLAVIRGEKPKEKEIWGELPGGTRLELLIDVEKLLAKAIDDIDNVASRSRDSKLLPKALFKLTDSCKDYLPRFKSLLDTAEAEKERGALLKSTEFCESVIEASVKLPREEKKKN